MFFMKKCAVVVALASLPLSVMAQACTRPNQPELMGEQFRALQKRAAYAAFLSDECGFDGEVQKRYTALVRGILSDEPDAQKKMLDEFKGRKNQFSSDASFLGVKKRCIVETGKTKSFVNDAADDVSSYSDSVVSARRKYSEKMEEWNACLERQRVAEEAARAQAQAVAIAAKATADAEEYKRSEEFARKKAVEDVEVGFRGSLAESGTYVLRLRNVSNQTADFQLKCFANNGGSKTFPIALSAGQTTEIGFLEGWSGNFVSGEYCQAIYKGEALWRVTKK